MEFRLNPEDKVKKIVTGIMKKKFKPSNDKKKIRKNPTVDCDLIQFLFLNTELCF